MSSPEWNILDRTKTVVSGLAADQVFVPYGSEPVRAVIPAAVQVWKVPAGGRTVVGQNGLDNIIMPGILITHLGAEVAPGHGLNCADDEIHSLVIQIVDTAPGPQGHTTPLRTYMEWMALIRTELLAIPNPFLQDSDPEVYDPYIVNIKRRTPADPSSMVRHEQQVAALSFQVTVRNHR